MDKDSVTMLDNYLEINVKESLQFVCQFCKNKIDSDQLHLYHSNSINNMNTIVKDTIKKGVYFKANSLDIVICTTCLEKLYNLK